MDRLVTDYEAGLPFWWLPEPQGPGEESAIRVSPDTGPAGGRAQRIETAAGGTISQWIHLPVHRVVEFEVELVVRDAAVENPGPARGNAPILEIAMFGRGGETPLASCIPGSPGRDWSRLSGRLTLPEGSDPDQLYRFVISTQSAANLVFARVALRPADHIDGSDLTSFVSSRNPVFPSSVGPAEIS